MTPSVTLPLLREFQSLQISSNEARGKLISGFRLPAGLDSYRLNAIAYEVDKLLPLVMEIKEKLEMLQQLGFQRKQIGDAIEHGLIPFLESLKPTVKNQLLQMIRAQPISFIKVEAFKTNFIAEYKQKVILRFIFQYYNLYEPMLGGGDNTTPSLCSDLVVKKTMFFEDWYSSSNISDFGSQFAIKEDTQLINHLAKHCIRIENANFESVLEMYDASSLKNLIIVTVNLVMPAFFVDFNQFCSREEEGSLNLKVTGFAGSYTYTEHEIPVFETFIYKSDDNSSPKEFILILDRTNLGCLKQYLFIEDKEQNQLDQHLEINIQVFAEHPDLVNTILQNPPLWLLNVGDKASQRAILEDKALVQTCEKLELSVSNEFKGYLVSIDRNM